MRTLSPSCSANSERSFSRVRGSDSSERKCGLIPSLLQNNQSDGDFRCWRRKGRGAGCHFWHDAIVEVIITGARAMHATQRQQIMQRWSVVLSGANELSGSVARNLSGFEV